MSSLEFRIPFRWRVAVNPARLLALAMLLAPPARADETAATAAPAATPLPLAQPSLRDVVRVTLQQQPEIRIAEQQVAVSRAVWQQARGQFDVILQAGISQRGDSAAISPMSQLLYGTGQTSLDTYTTNYYAAASKQFRFGMTTSASIQYNRVAQTALPAPYGQAVLVFSLVQPLLRGRGAESTAAPETAAKLQQEVTQLQLRYTISVRLRDTCIAYWNYVAAHQSVGRWLEAQERAQQLLADEQKLVQSGEHPASSLKLLAANLAEVAASAGEAERQRLVARQALGVAMGLPWEQLDRIGPPSDDFAKVAENSLPTAEQLGPLIKDSLARRADVLAAGTAIGSAQVAARAAQRALEPRLDVQADLGYAGLAEGSDAAPFFTAPYQNVSGVNFFAGLSLQYPVQNNAARGLLAQRQAEQAQAVLLRDNQSRQISSQVALLLASVVQAVRTLNSAEAAVAAYEGAVADEHKKLRAGLSTVFDLVQVQSRLNNAAQSALLARSRVATLIAAARFETGTLLSTQGTQSSINLDQLTVFPTVGSGTAGK